MELTQMLAGLLLPEGRGVISITGAGGKTSTMKALAGRFRAMGRVPQKMTVVRARQGPLNFAGSMLFLEICVCRGALGRVAVFWWEERTCTLVQDKRKELG